MAGADQPGVPPVEGSAVRIAYVTTDEVNATLARRWAHTCSCELTPLLPATCRRKANLTLRYTTWIIFPLISGSKY